jgi:DNA-binding NtrC family response regulator
MRFHENQTQALEPDVRRTGTVVGLRTSRSKVEFPLAIDHRKWLIGSAPSCDIVLDDPYVSSAHCLLERRPGGTLVVRDRRSRNGTLVDGNAIEGAELRAGSYLTLGHTTLVAYATAGRARASAIELLHGRDPVFRATVDRALKAAVGGASVLIVGETGTGKDLLARCIHEASRRASGRFVPVNCGGIPRELIASELFGHEKGAFTGAHAERDGYFVEADGGTLFLDELGELPIELQPHLLRALETRMVRRVGGAQERKVDVRIVAATNRLEHLGTDASRIRVDLYHRVATVVLALPPLRERMGDLVELVELALEEHVPEHGPKVVTEGAWRALAAYPWPGNVRELRHAVDRAVALGGPELVADDFFPSLGLPPAAPAGSADKRLVPYQEILRCAMDQALSAHGSIRAAAAHLGMAKSTFAEKAKTFGLLPRPRNRSLARVLPPPRSPPPVAAPRDDELRERELALARREQAIQVREREAVQTAIPELDPEVTVFEPMMELVEREAFYEIVVDELASFDEPTGSG